MSVALVIPAALWKPVGVASQQVVLRGNYKESHPVCLARRASVGAMAKKYGTTPPATSSDLFLIVC